jgi:uncharacterized protein (TIGR02449 family)
MEELLPQLEQRIQKLLKKLERLQLSNRQIQQTQWSLAHEKERLLTKHKGVVDQIETMVTRLKTLEGL